MNIIKRIIFGILLGLFIAGCFYLMCTNDSFNSGHVPGKTFVELIKTNLDDLIFGFIIGFIPGFIRGAPISPKLENVLRLWAYGIKPENAESFLEQHQKE